MRDEAWLEEHASPEWLAKWEQHFIRWPPLCVIAPMGFGHTAASVLNVNRGKPGDKIWQPSDFFPFLRVEEPEVEGEDKLTEVVDAFGRGAAWEEWRKNRNQQG